MASLMELQAQRAALAAARASGVSSAMYQGRKVDYRSVAEMDRVIASLDAEIRALSGAAKPVRIIYSPGCRGL